MERKVREADIRYQMTFIEIENDGLYDIAEHILQYHDSIILCNRNGNAIKFFTDKYTLSFQAYKPAYFEQHSVKRNNFYQLQKHQILDFKGTKAMADQYLGEIAP